MISSKAAVFDLDDFCDGKTCLEELMILKDAYPHFKATLFSVPFRTNPALVRSLKQRFDWIEFAVHGFYHHPNNELLKMPYATAFELLKKIDWEIYTNGFRPPGWYITKRVIDACNKFGLWQAIHPDDIPRMGRWCKHGLFLNDDQTGFHGHTHDTCGNFLKMKLSILLKRWPREQGFKFASEMINDYAAI